MIIVMGLPGAGKTTILKNLNCKLPVVSYGTLMFEVAKERWNLSNRDELRKMPLPQQKEAQKLAYEKLAKMGKIILDTHCSINTPNGYLPGLPFENLSKLSVDALVLITADLEEIKERRSRDSSRVRDNDDVAMHAEMNRAYLATYSAITGAPAFIIKNNDGLLDNSIAQLKGLIKRLYGEEYA